jgi:hypothetical protein
MPSAERIRQTLPSLFRPEPDAPATDLLAQLVKAIGSVLDGISVEAGEVMQAHWFRYADSALFSAYASRSRQIEGARPLLPGDPEVADFPYLSDLPRIAALLDLLPWREPLQERERVEDFRRRMERAVRLYGDGLGTREALRRVTLASLAPADRDAAPGLRERGFTIEEFAPANPVLQQAKQPGLPADAVGPLMRWSVDSLALHPTLPEIVVAGVAPVPNEVDPTELPLIERFDPASGTGVGIAYQGTLAPGVALSLAAAYSSWLATADGVSGSRHEPSDSAPADSTASGPWSAVAGGPPGTIVAFAQGPAGHLWAATNDGAGALWRFDGSAWSEALSGLPELRCLAVDEQDLLLGFATGIARLPLLVAPLAASPDPAGLSGPAVNALARMPDGTWLAATGQGAARLNGADALEFFGPGARPETETPLFAVYLDGDGTVFFGGERGLFRLSPLDGSWTVYRGAAADETEPDWQAWDPDGDALPADADILLPTVLSIRRGADQGLWLGTERGIARYRAKRRRNTYATLLEAWPQLGGVAVRAIEEDERGRVWFGTERGLFLFDETDWRQAQGGALVRLPRVEEGALAFTAWRFHRGDDVWQAFEAGSAAGFVPQTPDALGTEEPAVRAIAWTDGVAIRLGSFDGTRFTPDEEATPDPVAVRYKPDPRTVVTGGIPAVPRLPAGISHWRYLAQESGPQPTPSGFPAWTREGRLLPPPDQSLAPFEGRYLDANTVADFDKVFAFCPAATVWMRWAPRATHSVTVRLERTGAGEVINGAVLDRLWVGLNRVRPAGVAVRVAVGEEIVRGGLSG